MRDVHRGLARLASLDALWRIVAAATREACRSCGLDRAMLCHLRDGRLRFAGASYERDPQTGADFVRLARAAHPRLDACGPEHESAVRRVPLLVRDPQEAEGVCRLLVHTSQTRGYIVAPIVQDDVTIGLLHADRFGGVQQLDAFDLELVSLFATGLGWVMQRIAVGEGLQPTALQASAEMGATAASLVVPPDGSAVEPALAALTVREREVLGLMAYGASNARIAESLVISEATVKSHVGHILHKLAAKNRTEAVSRYHGFLARAGTAVNGVSASFESR